jgi:nitrogen fixation protein FixH
VPWIDDFMWIKLAHKKKFVLTQNGILFCISMFFALLISLVLLNTTSETSNNFRQGSIENTKASSLKQQVNSENVSTRSSH